MLNACVWKLSDPAVGKTEGYIASAGAVGVVTYDGVVFDMDGVLVEPAGPELLHEAARRAFEACGVTDPPAEHVEGIMLGVDVATLEEVCAHHDLDRATFWRTRDAYASRYQVRAALDGGKPVYDDVDVLAELSVPMGVVSTNQQATVDYLLSEYGLAERFEVAYGRAPSVEDLRRKKPAPHFLKRTMADLGVSDPLFVGDSESDVMAAVNAGVDAAFVRRPHREGVDLSVEPDHEVGGLTELASLLDG